MEGSSTSCLRDFLGNSVESSDSIPIEVFSKAVPPVFWVLLSSEGWTGSAEEGPFDFLRSRFLSVFSREPFVSRVADLRFFALDEVGDEFSDKIASISTSSWSCAASSTTVASGADDCFDLDFFFLPLDSVVREDSSAEIVSADVEGVDADGVEGSVVSSGSSLEDLLDDLLEYFLCFFVLGARSSSLVPSDVGGVVETVASLERWGVPVVSISAEPIGDGDGSESGSRVGESVMVEVWEAVADVVSRGGDLDFFSRFDVGVDSFSSSSSWVGVLEDSRDLDFLEDEETEGTSAASEDALRE